MRYPIPHPYHHLFLDALIAAVLMMVLGLTCSFFIQALVDFVFVLGRKPSSKSYLLARLNQRIDADTVSGRHRHLLGLPLTFCVLILPVAFPAIWAYFTPIDISVEARGIVRPEDGPCLIIAGIGGRINRLYVHAGSRVHRGDILVQLDTHDLLLRKAALEKRIHLTELRVREPGANTRPFRAGLFALYRELERTRLDLNRLTITSPADGEILSLASLQSGDFLSPGTAIAALGPGSNSLLIESWLSSSERIFVSAGQTVRLQADADLPDQYNVFDGTTHSISPGARFTDAYRILIKTASNRPELHSGTTLKVHFITRQERMLWFLFQKIRSGFEATVTESK